MIVSFDCDKRRSNRLKHGLDLADACGVFDNWMLETIDVRRDYGEERWLSIGLLGTVVVACAWANFGDEARVISLRRAEGSERERYDRLRPR